MSKTVNEAIKSGVGLLFVGFLLQLIASLGLVLQILTYILAGVFEILLLVGVILALVGAAKVKSSNPACAKGHTLLIVTLVFSSLVVIFKFLLAVPMGNMISGIFMISGAALGLVNNILIIICVSSLVKGVAEICAGEPNIKDGVAHAWRVLMVFNLIFDFLCSAVTAIILLIPSPALANLAWLPIPFCILAFIFSLIAYILVVVFFGKAKGVLVVGQAAQPQPQPQPTYPNENK